MFVFLLTFALSVLTTEGRSGTTVMIIQKKDYYASNMCSDTILSNHWVLSSGHCLEYFKEPDVVVVAGSANFWGMLSKADKGVKVGVKRIVPHPSQNVSLCLLELTDSLGVEGKDDISAAVLPPPSFMHLEKPITIGGYNEEKWLIDGSLVNATIATSLDCLNKHPDVSFDDKYMFCSTNEPTYTTRAGEVLCTKGGELMFWLGLYGCLNHQSSLR
eukprot:TRINITY_DN36963_c0_g1_i1.p1 TRINITY_DN36963_c0_g1~~TRINITY_DN36963_c0_g1_i1.p1  ORF type:complete len:231 (-),score=44.03 TRINITY_DN36963_c0_g1_i1:229-876(-)